MRQGFVYILVSPNSNFIKIGGTEHPIAKRLREINSTASYADHGPWQLSDFLHVTDWQLVEGGLHRHFTNEKIRDVEGTRELFDVPPHEARIQLRRPEYNVFRVDHSPGAHVVA
jgi:T5orf172 domain